MVRRNSYDGLRALLFAVSLLSAVHLGVFVWLSAFVYRSSIRGYVPAGLTGLSYLFLAALVLFVYLSFVASRRKSCSYALVGFVAPPLALVAASAFTSLGLYLVGYSFQNDMIVSGIGCVLFLFAAFWFRVGPGSAVASARDNATSPAAKDLGSG